MLSVILTNIFDQPRFQGLSSLPSLSTKDAEKRDPGNEVAFRQAEWKLCEGSSDCEDVLTLS